MDEGNAEVNALKEEAKKLTEKIDEKNQEIADQRKEKDKCREEYWEAMFMVREQRDEIAWIDWITETKDLLKADDEEREKHIQAMKEEMNYIKNPKDKEVDTCRYLIGVCNTLKIRAGLAQDSAAVAAKLQEEENKEEQMKKQKLMISQGRLEAGKTKEEREMEGMVRIGGGGGGKKGKKKKPEK